MFRRLILFVVLQIIFQPVLLAVDQFSLDQISDQFPYRGFEEKIEFWKSVYTIYGEQDAIFHDEESPGLIYDVVRFKKSTTGNPKEKRRQRKILKGKQRELEQILYQIRTRGIHSKKLNSQHKRVIELLKSQNHPLTSTSLRKLQKNVRYQRGIKERFRQGIIRSGQYLKKMETIFQEHNLPIELTLLPHVESSFNYKAYSKRGAAGLWQFMRGTGREYMKINRSIDERLDPIRSAEAAAQFLKGNYQVLGSWPLAVTAFNHGRNGMRRAKKRFGNDLVEIVQKYRSRIFKFASKNFYSEFLAAVEVVRNQEKYFNDIQMDPPIQSDIVQLSKSCPLDYLLKTTKLNENVLRTYNPQFRPHIWKNSRVFPAKSYLRIPKGQKSFFLASLKKAPSVATLGETVIAADGSTRYKIQHGDNLGLIANTFGISITQLKRNNGIRNANLIYPGQLLIIKGPSKRPTQYRVRWGDTLAKISRKFRVSLRLLQDTNAIDNPHKILLGQVLLIP